MFFCTAVALEDNCDSDMTTGTYYLPEQVSFCYQWNMGISFRTWLINVTFCGKLLFKNILADWLRQRAALMALEKKIPHIPILCKKRKRRFPFAFSTFLEQLDKKREGIYEKGFTKDSTQPHNHRRIAKRLVTKPSIISEEKKKKKSVICSGL